MASYFTITQNGVSRILNKITFRVTSSSSAFISSQYAVTSNVTVVLRVVDKNNIVEMVEGIIHIGKSNTSVSWKIHPQNPGDITFQSLSPLIDDTYSYVYVNS